MSENAEVIKILLVEDDDSDIELTRDMLQKTKFHLDLRVARNGEEALQYLRREGEFKIASEPDLILLDLNMPIMNGQETLQNIKGDDNLKHIPVVVLTTSDSDIDIVRSYTSGANCYISKPIGIDNFREVVKQISEFWFTVVKIPTTVLRASS